MTEVNVASESASLIDQLLHEYNYGVIFPLYDAIGDCSCGCVKQLLSELMLQVESVKASMINTQAKLRGLHHACTVRS